MNIIAISGKGGTGKTTIAALIIRQLSESEEGPVLAVDADANVNLNDVLGLTIQNTIGAIREEMMGSLNSLPGSMSKQQFLEYKVQASLVEHSGFDLIAMGRPEGPGCYCYANNLLRDILATLNTNYRHVIIDNEAGMEHLSRRTVQNIDHLLLISDPSVRGVHSAARISRLLKELDTRVGKKSLVINRVQNTINQAVEKIIAEERFDVLCTIPEDEQLLQMDQEGMSVFQLSDGSPAVQAVKWLANELK